MNYILFLTIVSSVCSIVGLIIAICYRYSWGKVFQWSVIVFILTFASGYAVNSNSENERIKNIHRQASAICEHYHSSYSAEFIQESLVSLEENRDVYPDSYNRAVQSYDKMKSATIQYDFEVAREMYGIVKGIATLNDE